VLSAGLKFGFVNLPKDDKSASQLADPAFSLGKLIQSNNQI
jgi:hypothetical protein